jgi:hypothetical protein
VHFGNVLDDSAALQLINADDTVRRTCFRVQGNNAVPAMSQEGLFAHVSKNMRYNLRNCERKRPCQNFSAISCTSKRLAGKEKTVGSQPLSCTLS